MIRPVTAVLGVLVVLALLIAPYVRPWVSQRGQISAAQADADRLREDVARLTAERDRWKDPAFVQTQARARLGLVKPGEIAYRVDGLAAAAPADPRLATSVLPQPDAARAWYATLWSSVTAAGEGSTRPAATAVR